MTDTAPEAQTQYLPQRWHIDIRMHIDLAKPDQTYVVAELAKKIKLGEHESWITQHRDDWLPGMRDTPQPGRTFQSYMLERLDELRMWLTADLLRQVQNGTRAEIRPEMGVSVPQIPHQAG